MEELVARIFEVDALMLFLLVAVRFSGLVVSAPILGSADFPAMGRNQVRNLAEKRIRTVAYICRA